MKKTVFTTSVNSVFVSSRFISNEVKCENVSLSGEISGFPESVVLTC